MTDVRATRWRVAAPATLSLVTLGLLYASPLLLVGTLVPLGYAVYGALSAVPGDASVRVERTIAEQAPTPGTRVTVTLTVTNASEAVLPDVRVVDGVPPELAVVAGSPRRSLALRPGESATVRYAVVARRGEFAFERVAVRLRSLAASGVRTESVAVAGDDRLTCRHPLSDAAVATATPQSTGTHPTDSGGPGTEFHSTREYRPGDPRNRIDWRRLARTGELSTVSFREERAVRTVLVVDAREPGRVAPRPGVPTGADLSAYAGERLFGALTGAGAVTTVTALGVDGSGVDAPVRPDGFPWADGTADATTTLARRVFAAVRDATTTSPAGDRPGAASTPATGDGSASSTGDGSASTHGDTEATTSDDERARLLLAQLPPTAEVVLVSPLLDDWPVSLVRTLQGQGHPVTVVSPDVTDTGTVGGTVADVQRQHRLATLATSGATTAEWTPAESLEFALAESVTHLVGEGS
ncbi:MAG: DUF58 domain-containing protein [Haloarculaceae archaeon]